MKPLTDIIDAAFEDLLQTVTSNMAQDALVCRDVAGEVLVNPTPEQQEQAKVNATQKFSQDKDFWLDMRKRFLSTLSIEDKS